MSDNIENRFGARLKDRRLKAHLSQKDLEILSGVEQTHISKVEIGFVQSPRVELAQSVLPVLVAAEEDPPLPADMPKAERIAEIRKRMASPAVEPTTYI